MIPPTGLRVAVPGRDPRSRASTRFQPIPGRRVGHASGLLVGAALLTLPGALRGQEAHVHGVAEVNVAIESETSIVVEFVSPASGIYGFEHAARTDQDRAAVERGLGLLRDRIGEMILFDRSLGCRFTSVELEVHGEEGHGGQGHHAEHHRDEAGGEHREVHAEFEVTCARPVGGSELRFGVTRVFPTITELLVQVLSETRQTGARISNDRGSVRL